VHNFSSDGKRILRVFSYNIWFAEIKPLRMQALMAVIAAADADIVCLQEVTHKTREILLQDSFIN
jgi:endonuclease/exonuclease/phosphatase family metal-dependent hydrolase